MGSPPPEVVARFDFTRAGGLYDAPFPSDDLRRADGTLDLSRVPNPRRVALIEQGLALLSRDARGFSASSAVYLPLTGPIDPASLPSVDESVREDASAFLYDLERQVRTPIRASFLADGGPFGAPNLVALLPLQGVPLRPGARYAAVLTRGVRDTQGRPLGLAPGLSEVVLRGLPGESGLAGEALAAYVLADLPSRGSNVVALSVFTTDDPVAQLSALAIHASTTTPPWAPTGLARTAEYDDFCVYRGSVEVPVYQRGEPPYARSGGDIVAGPSGTWPTPRLERAAITLTIPRRAMPADGYPIAVLAKAGLGGTQPLVDRGPHAKAGDPDVPGTGPAREFARAGFAGLTVDGPLTGSRNTTGGDEQFLIFNFQNAAALRDNIRQSALELALVPRALPEWRIEVSGCPGAVASGGLAKFDPSHIALFGHSMGATIAPLTAALSPAYTALILSGAGGSWIENVMDKQKPVRVRPIAEALIAYPMDARDLRDDDPALSLVQWAAELADPQVYAPTAASRHVLMLQGLVDHYILPDTANALSLPLGLDLAGPALDDPASHRDLADQSPLSRWLPFVGRTAIGLPASANQGEPGSPATRVVTQHAGDGIEDAHEVVFQREEPKRQYRCFLSSWVASGVPRVPAPGGAGCD